MRHVNEVFTSPSTIWDDGMRRKMRVGLAKRGRKKKSKKSWKKKGEISKKESLK